MEKIINLVKNNKLIFALIGIVIIGLIIFLLIPSNKPKPIINEDKYVLELFGDKEITIKQDEEYNDPGYYATLNNINVSDEVLVLGEVNTNKPGNYQITYLIGDQKKVRNIIVLEKEVEEVINFKLIGENNVTINLNEDYQELGVIANIQDGKDLSDEVSIQNNIQNDKAGVYYVYYYLEYNNEKYELKREVKVIEPLKITINYDKQNYYQELNLNIKVTGSNYKFLKFPNQVVTTEPNATYKIKDNGTYTFYVYDTNGKIIEESIVISNIDKEVDSASCNLNVKLKSSEIVITANDKKSGISYYLYNGSNYTDNKINVNKKLDSASVLVFDKTGNSKSINCQVNIVEEIYGFILIGDSRFVMMESHVGKNIRKNDKIIAKVSMGYKWLNNTAIGEVNKILKNNPNRKYYIMSNLGVNDFNSNYASKLSSLAKGEWKDHIVGYISVNPYADNNSNSKNNKKIANYNQQQKSKLDGVYYCDTYNGVGVKNFKASGSSGLHYNKATSKLIYDYIIKNCSF